MDRSVELHALREYGYDGVLRKEGDIFMASARDARVLTLMGRAAFTSTAARSKIFEKGQVDRYGIAVKSAPKTAAKTTTASNDKPETGTSSTAKTASDATSDDTGSREPAKSSNGE